MVAQAEFVVSLSLFHADFQRRNEPQQHSPIKKAQIGQDTLPSDVRIESLPDFWNKDGLSRRLSRISTRQAEYFFKELRVALLSALAYPQIVLNGSFDYRLIEVIRKLGP